MNRSIPVLLLEYNTSFNIIEAIYASKAIINAYNDKSKNLVKETNSWCILT